MKLDLFSARAAARPLPPPTQDHILVQAIQDGCIVLKSGDMAAVLEVTGTDLTRLSDDGRAALLAQYQSLLTTFRFPYQFIVARKTQRLEEYLDHLETESAQRRRERQPAYADYILDFVEFMQDVARRVNPQVPLYLVVLPYDAMAPGDRVRNSTLSAAHYRRGVEELATRSEQFIHGLTRMGLGVRRLDDQELSGILHRSYHPSLHDYLLPASARVKTYVVREDTPNSQPNSRFEDSTQI